MRDQPHMGTPAPSTAWIDQLTAHLALAEQLSKRIPAGENLDPKKIMEIVRSLNHINGAFRLAMQIHGFDFETMKFEG